MQQALIDIAIELAKQKLVDIIESREGRGRSFDMGALVIATVSPGGTPLPAPLTVSIHPLCGCGAHAGDRLTDDEFHELLVEAAEEMGAAAVVLGYGKHQASVLMDSPPCVVVEIPGQRQCWTVDGSSLLTSPIPQPTVLSQNRVN